MSNSSAAHPYVAPGSSEAASVIILLSVVLGFIFAFFNYKKVAAVEVKAISLQEMLQHTPSDKKTPLLKEGDAKTEEGSDDEFHAEEANKTLMTVFTAVQEGARAFLFAEYKYMGIFLVCFSGVVLLLVGCATN